jgi:maleate isomerase
LKPEDGKYVEINLAAQMPNYHFSPRGSFAVILPSTNVAVEAEYGQMLVPGISWHSGRILIRDPVLDSDAKFDQFMIDLRKEIGNAVENVMTAQPDFMGKDDVSGPQHVG